MRTIDKHNRQNNNLEHGKDKNEGMRKIGNHNRHEKGVQGKRQRIRK